MDASGKTRFTRRHLLQGSAAVAAISILSGCGSAAPSSTTGTQNGGSTPTNPQPVPSGSLTVATLAVTATATGTIGSRFLGIAFDKSTVYSQNYSSANTQLMGLLALIGPGVLRTGGSDQDTDTWVPTGPGSVQYDIAPADVNRLATFLAATGWQSIYGINMGGYYSSPATQTVANAVSEAEYVYNTLGSSLLGIEIGNEPDLYYEQINTTTGYLANLPNGKNYSVANYESTWITFYNAIVAAVPNIPIIGPATSGYSSAWTQAFGQYATKSRIGLLTAHYYRDSGLTASDTASWLISYPDTNLISQASGMQSVAKTVGIPWRMDENNSTYDSNVNVGVSDGFASSLWVLDDLFTLAQNGASGVNMFTTNGQGAGNYSPFVYLDPGSGIYAVHPEFYGLVLFSLAGQGTLYTTALSGIGSLNITAYAIKTASGGLNLIVVNKNSAQNLQLTVNLPQSVNTATLIGMTQLTSGATGPNLNATSGVMIQGSSISTSGSFTPATAYGLSYSGSEVSCYVPYLSAVLIKIT